MWLLHNMCKYQIIMSYIWNKYNVIYQLYLNKKEKYAIAKNQKSIFIYSTNIYWVTAMCLQIVLSSGDVIWTKTRRRCGLGGADSLVEGEK